MLQPEIVKQLEDIAGKEFVLTAKEDLSTYSYDGTTTWSYAPEVVVLPNSTEQVSGIQLVLPPRSSELFELHTGWNRRGEFRRPAMYQIWRY
ncbi:MAG: hypothetical protein P8Z37_19940 [Acidobacteriota bacterium]